MDILQTKIKELRKEIGLHSLYLFFILSLLIAVCILFYHFQTRETYMLFVYLGTIISSILLLLFLFLFIHNLLPRFNYVKLLKKSMYTNLYSNTVLFIKEVKDETYEGIACKRVLLKDKDEEEEKEFLIEESECSFQKEKEYKILSHDSFILLKEEGK